MATAALELSETAVARRLTADIRLTARDLSMRSARYLVDLYYQLQKLRIATDAMVRSAAEGESTGALAAMSDLVRGAEERAKVALGEWSLSHPLGRWARQFRGIGPVIAAGLIAHTWEYDFRTVSSLWRFAGLDPTRTWERGEKRPWNAKLKTLLVFRLGESFVKQQSKPSFYGQLFAQRKAREWRRNLNGEYKDLALENAKRVGKGTIAWKWNSGLVDPDWARERAAGGHGMEAPPKAAEGKGLPMLSPAHIHARARRWVAKCFAAHLWEMTYRLKHNGEKPPRPYIFDVGGHASAHFIPCPEREINGDGDPTDFEE